MEEKKQLIPNSTYLGMFLFGAFFDVLNWVLVLMLIGVIANTIITIIPALILYWIVRSYGVKNPWQSLNGVDPEKKFMMVWNYVSPYIPIIELVFGLWSVKIGIMWWYQDSLEPAEETPKKTESEGLEAEDLAYAATS